MKTEEDVFNNTNFKLGEILTINRQKQANDSYCQRVEITSDEYIVISKEEDLEGGRSYLFANVDNYKSTLHSKHKANNFLSVSRSEKFSNIESLIQIIDQESTFDTLKTELSAFLPEAGAKALEKAADRVECLARSAKAFKKILEQEAK